MFNESNWVLKLGALTGGMSTLWITGTQLNSGLEGQGYQIGIAMSSRFAVVK